MIRNIHGSTTGKIHALQESAAATLGLPIVFRDPSFAVRGIERVQVGQRNVGGWFGLKKYEAIYDEREIDVTVAPPEMVVIPVGSFFMGSPESEEGRDEREGPQHQVTFSRPFAIGRYAITFDEYDAFCTATGRSKARDEGWGRGRRPVINVSWEDAAAYCWWLRAQTGHSYRLPSEAEWEYACRAATTTPFHFGDTISLYHANYDSFWTYGGGPQGQSPVQTVPVGSLPANPWGLYEMHGNVYEWMEDCVSDKDAGTQIDGSALRNGDCLRRMLRGGSWRSFPRYLRSAYRLWESRGNLFNDVGFRVAMEFRGQFT